MVPPPCDGVQKGVWRKCQGVDEKVEAGLLNVVVVVVLECLVVLDPICELVGITQCLC